MDRDELLQGLEEKFKAMDQKTDTHLSGLLHSTPITYWDYIHVDALLGLQIQRTNLKDEMVFIMYHQINELLFRMILWEIEQISHTEHISTSKFAKHLDRISRYFNMLSDSFTIMGDGMDVDQYMKFRDTLTPASGFQSVQYRKIEIASTELINLIDFRYRKTIDRNTPYEFAFDNMYWQAAGLDHESGKKTTLLRNFENKYKDDLIRFMKEYNTINLWAKFKSLPEEDQKDLQLVNSMRHYDHTINVKWVMNHLNAAKKYLESSGETAEATGGSDWKKYMHPRYQRRIFYPELWSNEELENWGVNNLESHKILESVE